MIGLALGPPATRLRARSPRSPASATRSGQPRPSKGARGGRRRRRNGAEPGVGRAGSSEARGSLRADCRRAAGSWPDSRRVILNRCSADWFRAPSAGLMRRSASSRPNRAGLARRAPDSSAKGPGAGSGQLPGTRPQPRFRASLISNRCPSGSRKNARISHGYSTGGARNSAPRATSSAVDRPAVGDAEDHLGRGDVGLRRRRERHCRLVGRRLAAGHEQQPLTQATGRTTDVRRMPGGPSRPAPLVPAPRRLDVRDHEQVGQLRARSREAVRR